LVIAFTTAAGCGDKGLVMVPVEGKVTLNGAPLEGADVVFRPENGRPSFARTDAGGGYKLQYTRETAGALCGKHKVSITTAREADSEADDPSTGASRRERLPAKYNSRTELEVMVDGSLKTPVDFDLELTATSRSPDARRPMVAR
jgi:hypothetical protein